MKQLSFWNSIWEPLEVGWWIDWAMMNKIHENLGCIISVVTTSGLPVCGYVPNNATGASKTFIAAILGDGRLLKISQ